MTPQTMLRKLDSKKRVTLGADATAEHYTVTSNGDGTFTVSPALVITQDQLDDQTIEMVRKARKAARERFGDSLTDSPE